MKVAPLYHALKKERWAEPVIIHTGQHYDSNMSGSFFDDLGLPKPDISLGVGSGTHAEQTGRVMISYEKVLQKTIPDLVVVVGDVNSTMAATIAAAKLGIKVAHLEAGLRSFDRSMPEEINRMVTDVLADILWTPSQDGVDNLTREGIPSDKIHMVGNIMIDSLEMLRKRIGQAGMVQTLKLKAGDFGIVTLHRPSNVDNPEVLKKICEILYEVAEKIPLVFPIHPRTQNKMQEYGLLAGMKANKNLITPEPLNYINFMNLVFNCRLVITDSGGIQEETSYLGIPCLTLRRNTERPITITLGTNQLCELDHLVTKTDELLKAPPVGRRDIELWDGQTASRIVALLKKLHFDTKVIANV